MIQIYNAVRQKKAFKPIEEAKYGMYVLTVYIYIHQGLVVRFPLIRFVATLRYRGYDGNFVSNFTVMDDKSSSGQ